MVDITTLTLEQIPDLSPEQREAFTKKLERMQGGNPMEPAWDREKHWPLLEKLRQAAGTSSGDYVPMKDRPLRQRY